MIAPAKNMDRLRRAGAEVLRPRAVLSSREWTAANVRLSPDYETQSGPYQVDNINGPILDAWDDPDCYEITLRKSTRVGGTVTLIALSLAMAGQTPAPSLAVLPDRDAAIEFRDRVYADALSSRATKHLVPPRRWWNTRHIELGSCRIYLGWSKSRARLRGRACKHVFLSETDAFAPPPPGRTAPHLAARERTKRYWRWKIYNESSPEGLASQIHADYRRGNQCSLWAACPHCGHFQMLRFFPLASGKVAGRGGVAGYLDDSGQPLDIEEARDRAYYSCLTGCQITSDRKADFIATARHVPKGQRVSDDTGKLIGKPDRGGRHRSFWIWAIVNEMISFGDLAVDYLEKKADGNLPDFTHNTLGLPYKPPSRLPSWKKAAAKLSWPEHFRGKIPKEVFFTTAGADVQDVCLYWVLRGWCDQRTSYLIDWGRIDRSPEVDEMAAAMEDDDREQAMALSYEYLFEQLERDVLNKAVPIVNGPNPLGFVALRPRLLGVDCNHEPHAVHEWARGLSPRLRQRVRLTRGDHQLQPDIPWQKSVVEKNTRTGRPYKGGMEQWRIAVNMFKPDLFDRIAGDPTIPGGFRLPADIRSGGQQYLKQLVNEKPGWKFGSDGRRRREWTVISKKIGNDFFDCEVYARIMAEMIVQGQTWSAANWQRPKPSAQAGDDVGVAPR